MLPVQRANAFGALSSFSDSDQLRDLLLVRATDRATEEKNAHRGEHPSLVSDVVLSDAFRPGSCNVSGSGSRN